MFRHSICALLKVIAILRIWLAFSGKYLPWQLSGWIQAQSPSNDIAGFAHNSGLDTLAAIVLMQGLYFCLSAGIVFSVCWAIRLVNTGVRYLFGNIGESAAGVITVLYKKDANDQSNRN
jgi:hypothetical protein